MGGRGEILAQIVNVRKENDMEAKQIMPTDGSATYKIIGLALTQSVHSLTLPECKVHLYF